MQFFSKGMFSLCYHDCVSREQGSGVFLSHMLLDDSYVISATEMSMLIFFFFLQRKTLNEISIHSSSFFLSSLPSLVLSFSPHPRPPILPTSSSTIQEQREHPGPLLGGQRPSLPEARYSSAPLGSLPAGPQHAWHDDEDAVWVQGPLRRHEEEWVRRTLWHPFALVAVEATAVSPLVAKYTGTYLKRQATSAWLRRPKAKPPLSCSFV